MTSFKQTTHTSFSLMFIVLLSCNCCVEPPSCMFIVVCLSVCLNLGACFWGVATFRPRRSLLSFPILIVLYLLFMFDTTSMNKGVSCSFIVSLFLPKLRPVRLLRVWIPEGLTQADSQFLGAGILMSGIIL